MHFYGYGNHKSPISLTIWALPFSSPKAIPYHKTGRSFVTELQLFRPYDADLLS
jgi:hypothetical protein